jgi:uncharacterized protein (DUF885 family)
METTRTIAAFASEYEPKSATALLAHFRDIIGHIYPALLKLFHLETSQPQPLEITKTPTASASMAPAACYLAGYTDSHAPRPGIFYVNTTESSTRGTYECEALSLHEALVGHSLLRSFSLFLAQYISHLCSFLPPFCCYHPFSPNQPGPPCPRSYSRRIATTRLPKVPRRSTLF